MATNAGETTEEEMPAWQQRHQREAEGVEGKMAADAAKEEVAADAAEAATTGWGSRGRDGSVAADATKEEMAADAAEAAE